MALQGDVQVRGASAHRANAGAPGARRGGRSATLAILLNHRESIVTRLILDDARVHPAIRGRIADEGRAVIAEVEAAIAANPVVVVGMAWNPFPTKARKWLDAAGVPFKYLEYGNYMSQWRTRLPLKLWTGWTTFPMIFVDGQFIGGFNDLAKLDPATLKKGAGAASTSA